MADRLASPFGRGESGSHPAFFYLSELWFGGRLVDRLLNPQWYRVLWLVLWVACCAPLLAGAVPVLKFDRLFYNDSRDQLYAFSALVIVARENASTPMKIAADSGTSVGGTLFVSWDQSARANPVANFATGGFATMRVAGTSGTRVYDGQWCLRLGADSHDGRDYIIFYPAKADYWPLSAGALVDWSAFESETGASVAVWVKANFRPGELPFPVTNVQWSNNFGGLYTILSQPVAWAEIPEAWPFVYWEGASVGGRVAVDGNFVSVFGGGSPTTQPSSLADNPTLGVSDSSIEDYTLLRPIVQEYSNAPGQLASRLSELFQTWSGADPDVGWNAVSGGSSAYSAQSLFEVLDGAVLQPTVLISDSALLVMRTAANVGLVLAVWFWIVRRFADASGKPDMGVITTTVGKDGEARESFSGPEYGAVGGRMRSLLGGRVKRKVRL